MKKLKKSISVSLPPVRLFLEDVKAIEEIYKETCENFKIKTDKFELDSYEELKELGERKLHYLYLSSWNPYVILELEKDRAQIYSSEDDVISTGIVNKIASILDSRINWLKYASSFMFIVSNSLNLVYLLSNNLKQNPWLEIVFWVNTAILYLGIFGCFKVSHSTIYLINHEPNKFLIENKNQILLLITGGIITFLVQIVVQILVHFGIKY